MSKKTPRPSINVSMLPSRTPCELVVEEPNQGHTITRTGKVTPEAEFKLQFPDILLQIATNAECREMCRLTSAVHEDYCRKHGFKHIVAGEEGHDHPTASWDKLKLVRDLLKERNGRYVVLLDADAMVTTENVDLRDALPEGAWLATVIHPWPWPPASPNPETFHYNCGAMYWRSHPRAIAFLDFVLSHEEQGKHGYSEQCIVNTALLQNREWQLGHIDLGHDWNCNVHNQNHENAVVVAWHGADNRIGRIRAYLAQRAAPTAIESADAIELYMRARELHMRSQFKDAADAYRQVLALKPGEVDAMMFLADIQTMLSEPRDAVDWAMKVLTLEPDHRQAHGIAGLALMEDLQLERAEYHLKEAVRIGNGYPESRWHLGLCQLQAGKWREGWQNYRWRFIKHSRERWLTEEWRGKATPAHSLLVAGAEQGHGDTLQFLRFLPWLRERLPSTRLFVEVSEQLAPLLYNQCEGYHVVKVDFDSCMPAADIQQWVSLFSLPEIIGLESPADLDKFPKTYLKAAQPLKLPGDNLKVGIRWHGTRINERNHIRSLPEPLLAQFADIEGVDWYGLQFNESTHCLPLKGWVGDEWTFAETANLVAGLDLVVTTCTSIAHLAGAMGIPTVLMLARPWDWRWGMPDAMFDWYENMAFACQRVAGNWTPVIEEVKAKIEHAKAQRNAIGNTAD